MLLAGTGADFAGAADTPGSGGAVATEPAQPARSASAAARKALTVANFGASADNLYMALHEERTIAFDLWPIMLVVEGSTAAIGTYIEKIYDDPEIPREGWNVAHTERSRKLHAERLKGAGDEWRRQGMGVRTEEIAATLIDRARRAGLTCARLSSKTQGAL